MLYHCSTPNTVALTFDDGPWQYTQSILDTLAKYNVHATFFITGNNGGKGRIDDPSTPWPAILKSIYAAGHQLASHTWSHEDLTLLPPILVQNQIIYNEMAFRNIFGFIPAYIRPPYGFCASSPTCLSTLNDLGYHIILYDIDTKDYQNDDPAVIQNSKNWFSGNVSNPAGGKSFIELSHDTHQQTALTLVSFMLDTLTARGYKAVTVGECMSDPKTNWYRDAGGVPGAPAPGPALAPSLVAATTSKSTGTSPVLGVTALAVSTLSASPSINILTMNSSASASTTKSASTTSSDTTAPTVSPGASKSEATVIRISICLYGFLIACFFAGGL